MLVSNFARHVMTAAAIYRRAEVVELGSVRDYVGYLLYDPDMQFFLFIMAPITTPLAALLDYLAADEQGNNSHDDDLLETPVPSTDMLDGDSEKCQ